MPAAAITGLAAEARIARRAGLAAAAAGGDPARTEAAIGRAIADGARALVSFGICGGLDPALAPGTVLLPLALRDEKGVRLMVDGSWRARVSAALAARGIAAFAGEMLGADAPIATSAHKRALHRETGAIGADLESHHVAHAASRAGLPFLVLRAVADPASRGLPPAALIGLDGEGRAALGAVLVSLARQPRQLPALLQLALDTRRALRALGRAAAALAA